MAKMPIHVCELKRAMGFVRSCPKLMIFTARCTGLFQQNVNKIGITTYLNVPYLSFFPSLDVDILRGVLQLQSQG